MPGRWCRAGRRAGRSVIDEFLPKLEEWVERSKGKIRADVAHDKIARDGVHGVRADHPPGGRGDQEGVAVGTGAGAPAVGHRARDVGAVRLR